MEQSSLIFFLVVATQISLLLLSLFFKIHCSVIKMEKQQGPLTPATLMSLQPSPTQTCPLGGHYTKSGDSSTQPFISTSSAFPENPCSAEICVLVIVSSSVLQITSKQLCGH